MIKSITSALLALSLLLAHVSAHASVSSAEIEELACKAGLCQQVDAMHQQMLDTLDEVAASGRPGVDAEVINRLRRVADHAYAAERLRGNLMREIGKRLDEKDLPVLKSWFDSPAGRAIAKAEQAATEADLQNPSVKSSDALVRSSASRKRLLVDILRESRTAEASVDIIINTTLAVRNGVQIAAPGAPHADTRELRAALESKRSAMIMSFAQVSLPILATSYVGVSDADLASYLQFMQTEQGARFNEVSIRSFESALMAAAAEFGQAIPGSRKGLNV